MEEAKVDLFMMMNNKYFESYEIPIVRKQLLQLDDSKWELIQSIQFKDPTTSLIISILGGNLGIDRFFIGQVGLGILKLITCGGGGIWAIIDWFLIMGETRKTNIVKFQETLGYVLEGNDQGYIHDQNNREW